MNIGCSPVCDFNVYHQDLIVFHFPNVNVQEPYENILCLQWTWETSLQVVHIFYESLYLLLIQDTFKFLYLICIVVYDVYQIIKKARVRIPLSVTHPSVARFNMQYVLWITVHSSA